MSARESELPNLPPPCAAALTVLQRRLDGETVTLSPAEAAHVAACLDCRGRFAAIDQLIAALQRTEPPVPTLLSERIIRHAIVDSRRRRQLRRWSLAAVGMAAGVAAAVWSARAPAPVPEMARHSSPPDLRQDLTDAGEAVAALTRRAAGDAVDAGRQLVPSVPPWRPPALEPARPFARTGAALADGFEPVATSARRAALLFWRELPSPTEKVD